VLSQIPVAGLGLLPDRMQESFDKGGLTAAGASSSEAQQLRS